MIGNCPFTPTGNRICVVPQLQEATKVGIVLPKAEQERNKFFVVVAIGPDVEHLRVGDKVLPPLSPMAIKGMRYGDEDWFLTDEPSIPAVLKPAQYNVVGSGTEKAKVIPGVPDVPGVAGHGEISIDPEPNSEDKS